MPTEAELEQEAARQKVDDQAEVVASLALAAALGGGDGGSSMLLAWPAELEKAVASLAKLVGLAAVVSLLRPTAGGSIAPDQVAAVEEIQDSVAPIVRRVVEQDVVGAARQRQLAVRSGSKPPPDAETAARWAKMIGRTAATRAAAEAAIEMAEPIQRLLETELRKLWVSRGDSRVRPLHRRLHGKTEKVGDPFWRELGTGAMLRYPGDPRAPIGQTANCRCALFLARADEAKDAERVFHLDDSDFALAASAHQHPADLSPSGYHDLHAARRVRELEEAAAEFPLTAAVSSGHTGVVLVLIPDDLDEIEYNDGDRAPAHSTLAYMGSIDDATDEELDEVRRTAERLAQVLPGPFEASIAGLATLGDHRDEVMLVEAQEIQDLHDVLLSDETCRRMLRERNEHPHFIPHVSYPHAKAPDKVRFSKIGCWIGDDRVEYPL